MPAETLLGQLSSHLPQPFRFEWDSVESSTDPLLDTLPSSRLIQHLIPLQN